MNRSKSMSMHCTFDEERQRMRTHVMLFPSTLISFSVSSNPTLRLLSALLASAVTMLVCVGPETYSTSPEPKSYVTIRPSAAPARKVPDGVSVADVMLFCGP